MSTLNASPVRPKTASIGARTDELRGVDERNVATLRGPVSMLFRRSTIPDARTTSLDRQGFDTQKRRETDTARPKIRCPQCRWQPDRRSRWFCAAMGAPEFFDGGCGTHWNTFETGGKCPGCSHRWRYTSCLACGVASLHVDWYEEPQARH
jgi:hypothetical protein